MFTQEHYRQAQTSCIESGNADRCVEATATKGYMSATCGGTQQTKTSTPCTTTDQDSSSSNADMQRVIQVILSNLSLSDDWLFILPTFMVEV